MKHKRFVKKWKNVKLGGFKKYVLSTALVWTLLLYPTIKVINHYFNTSETFDITEIWWQLPMFFLSGICYAVTMWIVNNYLYAKRTGEFTPENYHHHHE